jgi:hypothetical protein
LIVTFPTFPDDQMNRFRRLLPGMLTTAFIDQLASRDSQQPSSGFSGIPVPGQVSSAAFNASPTASFSRGEVALARRQVSNQTTAREARDFFSSFARLHCLAQAALKQRPDLDRTCCYCRAARGPS